MRNKVLAPNTLDSRIRQLAGGLQNSHVCDHDTGVLGMNLGSGYLVWSGVGTSGTLSIDTERPAITNGSMPQIYARIAAGSKPVTLRLVVNSGNVASKTETVSTAWTLIDFSQLNTAFTPGDLLAIRYEGLTGLVDRMVARVLWSLATPATVSNS